MSNKSKGIAFIGVCTAVAMILAYVEAMIPPLFSAIPGIKMGLPNLIIVFLLYRRGPLAAGAVSLVRILLVNVLFGNAMALLYSLAGGVLSWLVMILLRRLRFFSTVGVSVAGGVAHNVGQVLAAVWLLETSEIAYYLMVLLITGTIAGILIGIGGSLLIKRIPKNIKI